VNLTPMGHLVNDPGTDHKISKSLTFIPFRGILLENRTEQSHDFLVLDTALPNPTNPVSDEASTKVDIVFPGSSTNKGNLCDVRTSTPIRATGHTNRDGILG
jgi:hypothetical protein